MSASPFSPPDTWSWSFSAHRQCRSNWRTSSRGSNTSSQGPRGESSASSGQGDVVDCKLSRDISIKMEGKTLDPFTGSLLRCLSLTKDCGQSRTALHKRRGSFVPRFAEGQPASEYGYRHPGHPLALVLQGACATQLGKNYSNNEPLACLKAAQQKVV